MPGYFSYWGKATPHGALARYHLLPFHALDVAAASAAKACEGFHCGLIPCGESSFHVFRITI